MPSYRLINDDQPGQFPAVRAVVVRSDQTVAGKPAMAVELVPPVKGIGAELAAALLVPRRRIDELAFRAAMTVESASVFVCRHTGSAADLPRDVAPDSIDVVFWGRVSAD